MAYKFRLEQVLHYHQSREEQALEELAQRQAALEEETRRVEVLESEVDRMLRSWREQSASQINLRRLCSTYEYMVFLRQRLKYQEQVREQSAARVQEQRHRVKECWQQRKIMEKLQEKDYEEYTRELGRQELCLSDELSLASYCKGKAI